MICVILGSYFYYFSADARIITDVATITVEITEIRNVRTNVHLLKSKKRDEEIQTVIMILSSQDPLTALLHRIPVDVRTKVNKYLALENVWSADVFLTLE